MKWKCFDKNCTCQNTSNNDSNWGTAVTMDGITVNTFEKLIFNLAYDGNGGGNNCIVHDNNVQPSVAAAMTTNKGRLLNGSHQIFIG